MNTSEGITVVQVRNAGGLAWSGNERRLVARYILLSGYLFKQ